MACIEWTNTMIFGRERAKHIDIRKHFAHEAAQLGHLRLKRVSTADKLADVFTENLQQAQLLSSVSLSESPPPPPPFTSLLYGAVTAIY